MNIKKANEIDGHVRGTFRDPNTGREYVCRKTESPCSGHGQSNSASPRFDILFRSPGGQLVTIVAWMMPPMMFSYGWCFQVFVEGIDMAGGGTAFSTYNFSTVDDSGLIKNKQLRGLVEEAFRFFEQVAIQAKRAHEDNKEKLLRNL